MKAWIGVLSMAAVMSCLGSTNGTSVSVESTVQAKTKCPYCGTSNAAKNKQCTSCRGNLDFVAFPKGTRLTKTDERDIQPAWSPDGKKIAYASSQRGDFIFVMNADGSNSVKIPNGGNIGDFQPSFGPGGKLAFVGHTVSNDIYTMDGDGSNRKRLTDFSADDNSPSWNDSGVIVFASDRGESNNYNLYRMDSNGENVVQITKDAGNNHNPCWSADGKRIAFNSDRDGNNEIYIMDADGSNVRRITKNSVSDTDPSWGPDGRIAFISERVHSPDVYIMNADGTGQKQITNNKWDDYWPCLGTEGRIVFQSRRDAGTGIQEDIYLIKTGK